MFKVNNKNTRTKWEICSKLTVEKPEWHQSHCFGVFIVNFEHISHLVLVFLLLTKCWLGDLMLFRQLALWWNQFIIIIFLISFTTWKVSKYGVFSGPYFLAFGLNRERYSVSLPTQSDCGKTRTRKNFVFGHFWRSASSTSVLVLDLKSRPSLSSKS